jgi:hypothetical protein
MRTNVTKQAAAVVLLAAVLAATTAYAASEPEARSERGNAETIVVEPRSVVPEPRIPPPRPPEYGFDVDIWTDRNTYEVGDLVRVYFRVTRPAYVYIFDTNTRGETHLLFPNHFDRDNHCVPGRRYYIPDANYRLRVVGPLGTEELRIVAVRSRPTFYRRYHRYTPSDPFMLAPEGAKGFLRDYRREMAPESESRRDSEEIRSRESRSERRMEASRRGAPETIVVEPSRPDTIIVEPPIEDRQWAEAYTTFRVVDPYHRPTPAYYGQLKVRSRPPGADVRVDGRYRGRTPITIPYLDAGSHWLEVSLPGFDTFQRNLTVREGGTTSVNVRLRPERPRFLIDFDFRF